MNARKRSDRRWLWLRKAVPILIGGTIFVTVLHLTLVGRPEILSLSDAAIFIFVVGVQTLPFVALALLSPRTGWAVLLSVATATAVMLVMIDVAIARCALKDPICGVYYILSPVVLCVFVAVVALLLSAAVARVETGGR